MIRFMAARSRLPSTARPEHPPAWGCQSRAPVYDRDGLEVQVARAPLFPFALLTLLAAASCTPEKPAEAPRPPPPLDPALAAKLEPLLVACDRSNLQACDDLGHALEKAQHLREAIAAYVHGCQLGANAENASNNHDECGRYAPGGVCDAQMCSECTARTREGRCRSHDASICETQPTTCPDGSEEGCLDLQGANQLRIKSGLVGVPRAPFRTSAAKAVDAASTVMRRSSSGMATPLHSRRTLATGRRVAGIQHAARSAMRGCTRATARASTLRRSPSRRRWPRWTRGRSRSSPSPSNESARPLRTSPQRNTGTSRGSFQVAIPRPRRRRSMSIRRPEGSGRARTSR